MVCPLLLPHCTNSDSMHKMNYKHYIWKGMNHMDHNHDKSCCNCCCHGPISPGIEPAYFNAVMQGGYQDVPPEGNVKFLLAFQSGDFSFTPNTAEIIVNTEGIYRIDYSLLIRPVTGLLNAAYAVAINGLENPLSFFGIYSDEFTTTERVELTGMFITSIAAGSTVMLRNKSATVDYLAGTGVDNQAVNHASILLQRIA